MPSADMATVRPDGGTTTGALRRAPVAQLSSVSKRYGTVQALKDVSLAFEGGRVHALLGANGAGKSTAVKILAGAVRADSGTMLIDGLPSNHRKPSEATSLGLSFIHQELQLVPKFTVLQNLVVGRSAGRLGVVDYRESTRRAEEVLGRLGCRFSPAAQVEKLSLDQRWMVSLARALMNEAKFVAMDEPTASFNAPPANHRSWL